MEGMDVRSFDWDDGPLRKAFEAWEEQKNGKKEKKGNKKRKWKVGDYCRAVYSDDNLYYEAKVISLNGDFCTLEFLGYGDKQNVGLRELKESEGKKARKQQVEASEKHSSEDSSPVDETSDGSDESHNSNKKKHHAKKSANHATSDTPMYKATFHQQSTAPPAVVSLPPSSMPVSLPFMPTPTPKAQSSVPPPPPMLPQSSILGKNPDIVSMMTAWYMAGYYTGLQEGRSGNQGCHCQSNHSSQSYRK